MAGLAKGVYAQDYVKNDTIDYVKSALSEKRIEYGTDVPSISIINNNDDLDKSATTSFVDAFLWASGIRAQLSTSAVSRVGVVYLRNLPHRERSRIAVEAYAQLYDKHFTYIAENGPCTRVDIITDDNRRYTIVYLDATQSDDFRLSCLYRNIRFLYGVSAKYVLRDFHSTFVADLRLVRCLSEVGRDEVPRAFSDGRC